MRYSIILPVYNDEKRLPDCAAALMNQPCRDMEILLVDRGSEDGSRMLCQGYQAAYSDVIRLKKSSLNAARNEGIRHARGDYLLFADCDALLRPDVLAYLSEQIEKTRADLYLLDSQGEKQGQILTLETAPELLLEAGDARSVLWKRQLFDDAYLRFPEEPGYDDLRLICKGMARSRSIVQLPQPIHVSKSLPAADPRERDLAVLDGLDDIRGYLNRRGLLECCRADLCRLAARLICDRACMVLNRRQETASISECMEYLNSRFPEYRSIDMKSWRGCETEKLLEWMAEGKWGRLRLICLMKGRVPNTRKKNAPAPAGKA